MEISKWTDSDKVEIKNQHFDTIDFSKLKARKNTGKYDFNTELLFENCSFDRVLFPVLIVGREISFKNCEIGELNCYGSYFSGGFKMSNTNVAGRTTFDCGVHNLNPNKFEISDCTFGDYVDFFDVYFEGPVKIKNNKFDGKSNLEIYLKVPFGIPEGMPCELANNSGNLQHVSDNDSMFGNKK